jgi:hypothetical protein
MTTDHDSDPDATVRMPRPAAPKKETDVVELEDLEDVDPDSTLIRDEWGNAIIAPPPSATPEEPKPATLPPAAQEWERTLRRPAYSPDPD